MKWLDFGETIFRPEGTLEAALNSTVHSGRNSLVTMTRRFVSG
jgi:hypothetical protein